jgi:hypothetical protein
MEIPHESCTLSLHARDGLDRARLLDAYLHQFEFLDRRF